MTGRRARAMAWVALALALAAAPALARSLWQGKAKPSKRDRLVEKADAHLAAARRAAQNNDQVDAVSEAHAAQGLYEKALALPAPTAAGAPGDAELHYRAYRAAYSYARDYAAAVRHIDGLRAADPLDPRDGGLDGLTSDLCHSLARLAAQGGPDADALYQRGLAEYETWFARIDEADPDYAPALATQHANAAELYMALGRLDEALHHYRRSADLGSPRFPELAYYGLAAAYDRDGQVKMSRDAMARAVVMDPDLGTLLDADGPASDVYFVPAGDKWFYVGLGREALGQRREAIESFRRYLREADSARADYRDRARQHIRELGGHAP